MRNPAVVLTLAAGALVLAGCAGPERKLGRGLSNLTEFAKGGEMARAVEQTSLWEGPEKATTGVVRGFNRSVARTLLGAFEVVTFPIPTPTYDQSFWKMDGRLDPDYSVATYNENWGGLALPETPGTPDNYRQTYRSDGTMDTDGQLGFTSGETALTGFPFGRFRVND
jgi:putative exosortase-associated protein (TIGR04073 family)